ncbi:MAG TPA: hypothetical protein VH539_11815 [Gemmatimonadaceae bacterium]
MAPVSQISAGVLPPTVVGAKELALVAALWEPFNHAGTPRLSVTPVLLEHERELLPNEFGARHSPLPRRARE